MFTGYFKVVSKVFQESFKRMFQERFKGVSSKIEGNLKRYKGGLRVFERSLKGVSRKFKWCFKGVSRKLPSSFKEV